MLKLLSITILSYLLIKLVIKYANDLKLLDIPNERSHHCNIIPSGAGIGFIGAFFIAILIFELQILIHYWHIFVAILIVFIIGILDDRHDAPPKLKFAVIFAAVLLIWLYDESIYSIGIWFGYDITLGWLTLPFTMFALAGFTNALNLIDGLDGLAASISIVILSFFAFIGYEHNNNLMLTIALFTSASLISFIILNWNPAKVFMGDSGSLSLGFIISLLAVMSIEYIHPIVILYLAAIPILDTLVVMTRRIRRAKSPFSPDKTHIHHILVKFFDNNVKRSVVFLTILQFLFSSIGYLISDLITINPNGTLPLLALLSFILMFILFYMIFTGMQKRQSTLDSMLK